MPAISVLILTLNEEANLDACLDSCAWCDDVVVLDSFSSDGTTRIAAQRGVRLHQRAFDHYAGQRNAGLNEIRYKHPWVLMVDADERVPSDLVEEMDRRVAAADVETVLFRMRRKDFFLGRWLRRSSGYPTWFGRLLRVGRVRVEREINEEFIADGKIGHLHAHLHHFPFNRGISYWYERHNRYSTMEAIAKLDRAAEPLRVRALWSTDPIDRRRNWKRLAYRLPMRPALVFFYWYAVRLGMFDGKAGLTFSMMRASYEFLIDLKVLEAERRRRGAPV